MDARLDYGSSEILQKFVKHINSAAAAVPKGTLPLATVNLADGSVNRFYPSRTDDRLNEKKTHPQAVVASHDGKHVAFATTSISERQERPAEFEVFVTSAPGESPAKFRQIGLLALSLSDRIISQGNETLRGQVGRQDLCFRLAFLRVAGRNKYTRMAPRSIRPV